MSKLFVENHNISISTEEDGISFSYNEVVLEDNLYLIEIKMKANDFVNFPKVRIEMSQPLKDIQGRWHPSAFSEKSLGMYWANELKSWLTRSAPVVCFFNLTNSNRLTYAFSDPLNPITMELGANDDENSAAVYANLFTLPTKPMKEYDLTIRIDKRDIPYYEAIKGVSMWWENMAEFKPMPIPETAKDTIFSLWYNFHQEVNAKKVEKACEESAKHGMKTVILDDGWQTSDIQRGYGYCGDWEPSPEKFPDMKGHVKKIHDMGLKYMLWYALPFMGKFAKDYERFKDKSLMYEDSLKALTLDPRYPEVRAYLIDCLARAVEEWGLDGLKVDFVDRFFLPKKEQLDKWSTAPGKDFENVQEAVDVLLSDLMKRLVSINPDILIEFRQSYIGPAMRKYGNLFRVADCHNNPDVNRIGICDIRLLCGDTIATSDPIIWNSEDLPEAAAQQIISAMFSVLQISIEFEKYSPEHLSMLDFWVSFCDEHKDTLLTGSFEPLNPQSSYNIIRAEGVDEVITAFYSKSVLDIDDLSKIHYIVNGAMENVVYVDCSKNFGRKLVQRFNCIGGKTEEYYCDFNEGIHKLYIDKSGFIIIS